MKRKIVATAVISVILTVLLSFAAMALLLRPTALGVGQIDLSRIADGEYIGVCQNKILFAVVEVEIKEHEIARIDILAHKESYLEQAELFSDLVVSAQSLDVDAVSGATLSSDTVRKAIENALKEN